jgi:hypothetical protein
MLHRKFIVPLIVLCLLAAVPTSAQHRHAARHRRPKPAPVTPVHCGQERWPVKTGVDPDAKNLNLDDVHPTTINELQQLNGGHAFSQSVLKQHQRDRMNATERTVFSLDATLTAYKIEGGAHGDSDYHLVLQDSSCPGSAAQCTMVAEIPLPSCLFLPSHASANSLAIRQRVTAARTAFSDFVAHDKPANLDITKRFRVLSQPVSIIGLGFFDFDHGQRGRAPNIVEIHPVLTITLH